MENLIIILSLLLNIALIIALAVYMKRFNKVSEDYKKCVNDYELVAKKYRDTSLDLSDSRYLNTEINKQLAEAYESKAELIQKCNRQYAEIESLQSINNTLLNDNRELSDELQEIKNKPFDPISELDILIPIKTTAKGNYDVHTTEAKPKPKTKKGLKINYPDKNDFRNNV